LNHTVAKLLNKLLVEFTKSRAYRTTDNALVEGKNRAVIRKQIGSGPIAEHADAFQQFYTADLNPSWNCHRPCGSATIRSDARGKRKRIYPHQDYCPPYEKLRALAAWEKHWKRRHLGVAVGAAGGAHKRYSGRPADAEGQADPRPLPHPRSDEVSRGRRALWKCRAVDAGGKTLVLRYGQSQLDIEFPAAAHRLGNRQRRDFPIPTAPTIFLFLQNQSPAFRRKAPMKREHSASKTMPFSGSSRIGMKVSFQGSFLNWKMLLA
jgi:hypothetical protein